MNTFTVTSISNAGPDYEAHIQRLNNMIEKFHTPAVVSVGFYSTPTAAPHFITSRPVVDVAPQDVKEVFVLSDENYRELAAMVDDAEALCVTGSFSQDIAVDLGEYSGWLKLRGTTYSEDNEMNGGTLVYGTVRTLLYSLTSLELVDENGRKVLTDFDYMKFMDYID